MLRLGAALIAIALLFIPQSIQRLDTHETISYFIEDGKGVPGYRDSDRELAALALKAWSRESNAKLKFSEAKFADAALIRFHWISPSGGLYGETQPVRVNGKAGAIVNVMP